METTPAQPGHENNAIDMPPPAYSQHWCHNSPPAKSRTMSCDDELDELDTTPFCRDYVLVDIFVALSPFVTTTLVASITANNGMKLYKRGFIYTH